MATIACVPAFSDFLYPRQAMGIHGLGHETRVLIWTYVLSERMPNEDRNTLAWAAKFHDTQRWDDEDDLEHGERVAILLEQQPDLLPTNVDAEKVIYLCRWHAPSDDAAPEMTRLLKVFKDSDALDRHRIDDLDPQYLRTSRAVECIKASYNLWRLTSHSFDPPRIIQSATTLNIIPLLDSCPYGA